MTFFEGTRAEIRVAGWRYWIVLATLVIDLAVWTSRVLGVQNRFADMAGGAAIAAMLLILIGPLRPHRGPASDDAA